MKNIKTQKFCMFIMILVLSLSFDVSKGNSLSLRVVSTDTMPSLYPDSKSYLKPYTCKIAFDGIDSSTGEFKMELMYESLFSHTAPHIKPYLPGKDLLTAEAKFIKLKGGYTFLSILFHWNAKNPDSAYGHLKSKGAIRCYLSQNKSITLYNTTEAPWQKGVDLVSHSLSSNFLIHPRQIKTLKKYPLKSITVYWERGYENYPIYPVTLFMDQLGCLE